MSYCHGAGGNQLFRITEDGQFRIHDQCAYKQSSDVRLRRCDTTRYQWVYNTVSYIVLFKRYWIRYDSTSNMFVDFEIDMT